MNKHTDPPHGRNISSCRRAMRLISYQPLIRPQLEYAATGWDNAVKARVAAVESVERRAARFITGDYGLRSTIDETAYRHKHAQ